MIHGLLYTIVFTRVRFKWDVPFGASTVIVAMWHLNINMIVPNNGL